MIDLCCVGLSRVTPAQTEGCVATSIAIQSSMGAITHARFGRFRRGGAVLGRPPVAGPARVYSPVSNDAVARARGGCAARDLATHSPTPTPIHHFDVRLHPQCPQPQTPLSESAPRLGRQPPPRSAPARCRDSNQAERRTARVKSCALVTAS